MSRRGERKIGQRENDSRRQLRPQEESPPFVPPVAVSFAPSSHGRRREAFTVLATGAGHRKRGGDGGGSCRYYSISAR
ncbi:uncharacterized protein DS421_15g506970 [Arachis hypogaea]|nr:uncharacterized protein DS421_15g506970 [Arachis hypogaea]